jgi:hypothetical protein
MVVPPSLVQLKFYYKIKGYIKLHLKSLMHSLVENPPFLTKSFQLHDICNYVSTRFFKILKSTYGNYQLSLFIYYIGI